MASDPKPGFQLPPSQSPVSNSSEHDMAGTGGGPGRALAHSGAHTQFLSGLQATQWVRTCPISSASPV